MKKKIELVILIFLYMLLGYTLLNPLLHIINNEKFISSLISRSLTFTCIGVVFFGSLYYLIPILQKGKLKRFLLLTFALIAMAYFTLALVYLFNEPGQNKVLLSNIIHPVVLLDSLPLLLSVLFFSLIYSGIKHLFVAQQYILLKKIAYSTLAVITIVGGGFFINMQINMNYKGDQHIMFIENQFENLNEVIQLPQFRDKVVYVDLWHSACSPCIEEFQHLASFKNQLKGKEIAYLYIGRETSHQNSRERWLNAIKKYNLQGWHFYMSRQIEPQVWNIILEGQQDNTIASYPRYLLIDKKGKIVSFNAERPSSGKKVTAQIEALL